MLIVGDANIPNPAIDQLSNFGQFVPFKTNGLVYDAVSGHPDLFFCEIDDQWVMAPNLPEPYHRIFANEKIKMQSGAQAVGNTYPDTARYNAVATKNHVIHNLKATDKVIENLASEKLSIHVNQAYTRCNLLPLSNDRFVTSDEGIYKTLSKARIEIYYFSPEGILLPGFRNGFLGGCCGIIGNQIFIIGQLRYYPEGEKLRMLLQNLNYEIIELYDGPLFDGGSLFFIP
jgi:hypothetical protein